MAAGVGGVAVTLAPGGGACVTTCGGSGGVAGFWAMMLFLVELAIGFVYLWRKGALEWD